MDKRVRERRALVHELRSAIERNELLLYYQPQAQIDGEVTGFEALVRWRHPTRGLIPPGTFIPIAEECGLILTIGEWILRESCREAASWPQPLEHRHQSFADPIPARRPAGPDAFGAAGDRARPGPART